MKFTSISCKFVSPAAMEKSGNAPFFRAFWWQLATPEEPEAPYFVTILLASDDFSITPDHYFTRKKPLFLGPPTAQLQAFSLVTFFCIFPTVCDDASPGTLCNRQKSLLCTWQTNTLFESHLTKTQIQNKEADRIHFENFIWNWNKQAISQNIHVNLFKCSTVAFTTSLHP